MDRTCKYCDSCGMDYCRPEIVREGIECPHYERKAKGKVSSVAKAGELPEDEAAHIAEFVEHLISEEVDHA